MRINRDVTILQKAIPMDKNLDEKKIGNSQKWFSKLSLVTSLISLGLLGNLLSRVPKTIDAHTGLLEPPAILILAFQIFCVLGIVMTVLSFSKKESATWYKWLGGVLNIVVFTFLVGSVIFAKTF